MSEPSPSALKERLQDDIKTAMKARDKPKLDTLRLVSAALKQVEVDERRALTDADVLNILDKMTKQRKDSLEQYTSAGRADLAEQESFELGIIAEYLPEALSEDALRTLIDEVFAEVSPGSIKDMGRVMAALRPKVQGRADMGEVSAMVKGRLNAP